MTKRTGGASEPVIESFDTFYDGYLDGVTTTAVPLTADEDLDCYQVLVQNDPGNTVNIKVGNATSQSVVLEPGDSEVIPHSGRVEEIYVIAASGTARVNWHAMR